MHILVCKVYLNVYPILFQPSALTQTKNCLAKHKNLKIKRNVQTEVELVRFKTSTLIDRRFTCKNNENNDHV